MKRLLPLAFVLALAGQGCLTPPPSAPAPRPMAPPPESSEQNMPPQEPTAPAKDQSSTYNIIIQNFTFAPLEIQVKRGDKISVTNRDGAPHSVTSDASGLFDTGVLSQGKSATIDTAGLKPGTYAFHCSVHPSMKGTLVVN